MKKARYLFLLTCVLFFAVLFLPGFTKHVSAQTEEGKPAVKEKTRGESVTKEGYSEEQRREYKRKVKEELMEFDKKMKELEARVKETGAEEKEDVKKEMQELKEKRKALKKEIRRLDAARKKTWDEAKQKIDAAMGDLEKAYEKVRSSFASK